MPTKPSVFRAALLTALTLAALAACGDSTSGPDAQPDPPRAAAIAVSPESATLSSLGETATFTATVTDQYGAAFPATVTWSSSDPDVFSASSFGTVTAVANGSGTLTATFGALSATAQVAVQQSPASLVVTAGDAQEGTAGSPLPEPVVVRVVDAGGSPVPDVPVMFTAAEGHGSADPGSVVTDPVGLAGTSWTLGNAPGVQSLTASLADGVSAEIAASAGPLDPPSDSAAYRIVFNATWSSSTHPANFPSGAHFSPLIGAVHNDSVSYWELGETATPGIENMAETGGTNILTSEIRATIPGRARAVINGRGIGSPGSATIQRVTVTLNFPLVTLVTMIAPSPDWFVGVSGQSLMDGLGQWVDELEVVLYPLDSGSDDGTSYASGNDDSSPKQPIRNLKGINPFSEEPIGTFTFTRIDASSGRP